MAVSELEKKADTSTRITSKTVRNDGGRFSTEKSEPNKSSDQRGHATAQLQQPICYLK